MVNISSRYPEVSLNLSMRSNRFDLAKKKYRGMFETQKVRRHYKFRKECSQHYNKFKSQMGQDMVSGGVSVLCWLAAPVAMFYGNIRNLIGQNQ